MIGINMPMPEKCGECGFYNASVCWAGTGLCTAMKASRVVSKDQKVSQLGDECPLIEMEQEDDDRD